MLLFGTASLKAAETADGMLRACAAKINATPSVSFKLTMTADNRTSHPTLIVSKDKYRLSSPEMEVWFDGRTMWVYISSTREVTISEPTAAELAECNPMSLLNGYAAQYAARVPASTKNMVELVARNKTTALRKAVIEINGATGFPSRIDATMAGQSTVKIRIDSATAGKALPASTFIYDPKAYPATETTDLR